MNLNNKSRITLSDKEIIGEHFKSLEKLSKLCSIYDEGDISIAEEISVKLRVLLNDTKKQVSSTSLVLKMSNRELASSYMFSSAHPYYENNAMDYMPLIAMQFRANSPAIYSPVFQAISLSIQMPI